MLIASYILLLLLIFPATVLLIFSSKKLSPIPYFPTNKKDIPLIIKIINLSNNQIVFDLGAGDGNVIFEMAKEAKKRKLNTHFVAIEINPLLLLILHLRRFFHQNKKNIKIVFGDIFKIKLEDYKIKTKTKFNPITSYKFYLYISPWFLNQVSLKIRQTFPQASIISYMYSVKNLKKKEKIFKGEKPIFVYS